MITFFLTTLLLFITTIPISAHGFYGMEKDDQRSTQTLFNGDVSHGGYGGLVFGATHINGELSYLRGSRGAWIINFSNDHALNLGIGRYRTGTDFEAVNWTADIPRPEMRTNYSGFEMEYVNQSYRLLHFSVQSLIGSGSVRYDDRNIDMDKTRDTYFVLQPGVNVNLNITSWFRLNAGVLYRFASGVSLQGTSNSDLSGGSGYIGLRFGGF